MGFWQEVLEFFGIGADSFGWIIDLKISRKFLLVLILLFVIIMIIVVIYYNFYYVKPTDYSAFWNLS